MSSGFVFILLCVNKYKYSMKLVVKNYIKGSVLIRPSEIIIKMLFIIWSRFVLQ